MPSKHLRDVIQNMFDQAFMTTYFWPLFWVVLQILAIVIPLLVAVAYLTWAERKVMGAMQLRQGPATVGPYGLLQPLADGIKLFSKEIIVPKAAHAPVFIMAPMLTFFLSLVAWAVIPVDIGWVLADINVGILYLFAVSSLCCADGVIRSVYGACDRMCIAVCWVFEFD